MSAEQGRSLLLCAGSLRLAVAVGTAEGYVVYMGVGEKGHDQRTGCMYRDDVAASRCLHVILLFLVYSQLLIMEFTYGSPSWTRVARRQDTVTISSRSLRTRRRARRRGLVRGRRAAIEDRRRGGLGRRRGRGGGGRGTRGGGRHALHSPGSLALGLKCSFVFLWVGYKLRRRGRAGTWQVVAPPP